MAKSKAQEEKQKRATEKRKKTEKAVLKIAAAMPNEDPRPASTPGRSILSPPQETPHE